MLRYFADSVDMWRSSDKARLTLRSLPVHLAVHGAVVSLGVRGRFLLTDELPGDGMEHWQRSASLVLLRPCPPLVRLYEVITGCVVAPALC